MLKNLKTSKGDHVQCPWIPFNVNLDKVTCLASGKYKLNVSDSSAKGAVYCCKEASEVIAKGGKKPLPRLITIVNYHVNYVPASIEYDEKASIKIIAVEVQEIDDQEREVVSLANEIADLSIR